MNSIHDAIEARWAQTAALAALVPTSNLGVGKFPAERVKEITYPYVSREIQSEPKLFISSDGEALSATVMFRIWSPRHEDGQAVRVAFRGDWNSPSDGFHNKAFIAGGRRVLLCREMDWGEFQEPDGMWSFMMPVQFDHMEDRTVAPDPDPDPVDDEEAIMFAQIDTVSVAGTVVESSLIGNGEGDATILANDWEIGEEWVAELSGDWTNTGSESDVVFKVSLGGVVVATYDLALLFGGSVVPWYARVRATRLTTGPTGTIKVESEFVSPGTNANPAIVRDAAALTLASDADVEPAISATWAVAHANNRFRMMAPSSFRIRRMVTS